MRTHFRRGQCSFVLLMIKLFLVVDCAIEDFILYSGRVSITFSVLTKLDITSAVLHIPTRDRIVSSERSGGTHDRSI